MPMWFQDLFCPSPYSSNPYWANDSWTQHWEFKVNLRPLFSLCIYSLSSTRPIIINRRCKTETSIWYVAREFPRKKKPLRQDLSLRRLLVLAKLHVLPSDSKKKMLAVRFHETWVRFRSYRSWFRYIGCVKPDVLYSAASPSVVENCTTCRGIYVHFNSLLHKLCEFV